jgi:hypothetical protein
MKRVLESRLAPAIVVGLVGVIVVAGIAIAGPAISSKKKSKGLTAAKVAAIADAEIAAKAPTLTVGAANTANTAGTANSVAVGGLKQAAFKLTQVETVDFSNMVAGACQRIFLTVPGVSASDTVILSADSAKDVAVTLGVPNVAKDSIGVSTCNTLAVPFNPPAFGVRINVIGP